MSVYIKAAALALAMTAAGATGAMAGKTTTPNPTSPPVVVFTASQTLTGITASSFDNLSVSVQSAYIQALLDQLQ